MKKSDFAEFCDVLGPVFEIYNRRLSDVAMSMFFRYLDCLSLSQFKAGLQRHVTVCRFAPTPADIIQAVYGTEEDRAREAWAVVTKAMGRPGSFATVRFQEPAIHYALNLMGGWLHVCFASGKDREADRDFCRHYTTAVRRDVSWQDVVPVLMGAEELSARRNGWVDRIPAVREIGHSGEVETTYVGSGENAESIAAECRP